MISIGTGSWSDDAYVGLLYPPGRPPAARLGMYAHWFDRVEVNSTYYATPPRATVAAWAAATPPHFRFDLKLHRAFSQNPARAAAGDLFARLLAAAEPLFAAEKFGCFLLTLAPSFAPDRHRLEELDALVAQLGSRPLAVELRHTGWVTGAALAETLAFFRSRRLVWVALDLPRLKSTALLPPLDEVTHPELAYVRLHGRNRGYLRAKTAAARHHYDYSAAELAQIARRLRALAKKAPHVHVSVNNHAEDFAPRAALALRRLLRQPVPTALPAEDAARPRRKS